MLAHTRRRPEHGVEPVADPATVQQLLATMVAYFFERAVFVRWASHQHAKTREGFTAKRPREVLRKEGRQRTQRLRPRPPAVLDEAGPVHGLPENRPEHLNPLSPIQRQHSVRVVGEPLPKFLVLQRLRSDVDLGPSDRVLTPDSFLEFPARPLALRNGRDLLQELGDSREPVRVNPLRRLRARRPESVLALQVPTGFGHSAPLSRTLPAPGRE